jgi:phosphatidylglycerol:prolipoprotein diacylglycerol transferase
MRLTIRRDNSQSTLCRQAGGVATRMYPDLLTIGSFTITSFGAMVALGALVGLWLFSREIAYSRLPASALDAALSGIVGGLAGAKLLFVAEHFGEEPFTQLLFARGGLSWYGGLAGGIVAGVVVIAFKRLPLRTVIAAATPALAVGHALGRIGCFLVGDDYGRPSNVPWAVAFPRGLPPTLEPVHPTQLYEMALLFPLAWLLVRFRRRGTSDRQVIGLYLSGAGAIRFAIEWWRVDVRVALGMSVAHWASLIAIAAGIWLLSGRRD